MKTETESSTQEAGSAALAGYAPQPWSAEQPAVAGWWWLRRKVQDVCGRPMWTKGVIVQVMDDYEGIFYLNGFGSISAVIRIKTLCGEWSEWSGPLPEPVEASDVETWHIEKLTD